MLRLKQENKKSIYKNENSIAGLLSQAIYKNEKVITSLGRGGFAIQVEAGPPSSVILFSVFISVFQTFGGRMHLT